MARSRPTTPFRTSSTSGSRRWSRRTADHSAETLGYYRSHVRWILDPDKTEQPLGAYQLRHVRPVIIQAALDSAGVSPDMRKTHSQRPRARVQPGDLPRGHQRQPGHGRPFGPCATKQEEARSREGPGRRTRRNPRVGQRREAERTEERRSARHRRDAHRHRHAHRRTARPSMVRHRADAAARTAGRRRVVPVADGERPDHLERQAGRLRQDPRRDPPHRAPGLGCGAATPAQGCPDTQRPRRGVHHPQRHLALPHQRPGPAAAHPPTSTTTPTSPRSRMSHPTPSAERWQPRSTRSTTPRPP